MPDIKEHFDSVIEAIEDNELTLFLGAGANLCDREPGKTWNPEAEFLPNGRELAEHLAEEGKIPIDLRQLPCSACGKAPPLVDEPGSLSKIAEYISIGKGVPNLHNKLRRVFNKNFLTTTLHRLIAEIPSIMETEHGCPDAYQVIITTNYDDLIDNAFAEKGQDIDILTYKGPTKDGPCKFEHRPPTGEVITIREANLYPLSPTKRPVIVKFHGAVDRNDKDNDSFVISEDDYLDYLAGPDVAELIPQEILERLRKSSFLFLGYSLTDWNLRVFLQKIFESQAFVYPSWSIQYDADAYTVRFWGKKGVEVINMKLSDYVKEFRKQLSKVYSNGAV